MNRRLNAFALGALLLLSAAASNAQNVFVLPASISGSSNVGVFSANPFSNVGNLNVNPAANLVLATPDGTKFYIISNSGSNSVIATDSTFSGIRPIASLGVQPTTALITPDGKRLLVGAGTLQIFDTTSDLTLVGGGLNVMGTVVDVAVNLESTRAFALVNTGSGSQVTVVDLSTNAVIGTIPVPGFGTGVSTGPNDLVYISTQNVILEVDPRSAAVRQQMMSSGDQLAIGGKSMGGRIASQVAAAGIGDLAGLVFLGYPLHPPGRPDRLRAAHLPAIKAPMLFVQGSRDAFGTPEELRPIITRIEPSPALYVVAGGDHSFKVPKRSDVTQEDVHRAIQDHVAGWLREQVAVRTAQ